MSFFGVTVTKKVSVSAGLVSAASNTGMTASNQRASSKGDSCVMKVAKKTPAKM
jgi:hypothetical protein